MRKKELFYVSFLQSSFPCASLDLGYFKLLTTYNDVRTKNFYCYKNNSKVLYISDTKRLSDIALVIYRVCALAKLFTVLLVPVNTNILCNFWMR